MRSCRGCASYARRLAEIVLATVYDPSDGHRQRGKLRSAALNSRPQLVRALDAAPTELAERHGAIVADVHGRFLGHGGQRR
jgi:hypothetical protein